MNFALLSEVWPDMVQKPKKKKLKRKKIKDPLMDPPLSPDEMDTELLDDDNNENEELDPRRKLKGMRVSPYTDNEIHYQNVKKQGDLELNENILRPDRQHQKSYENDPEYQEFLEFKRMKERKKITESKNIISDQNEQFNELLLYVFTGFFLLMIYDNIYKLGKDSFY